MDNDGSTCGTSYLGICLDSVSSPGKIDSCTHTFHFKCIFRWSRITNQCPTCRVPFSQIQHYAHCRLLKRLHVRRRTQNAEDSEDSSGPEDSLVCQICLVDENERELLLCDGDNDCQSIYHTYCVGQTDYPTSRWLCPECQTLQDIKDQESDAVASVVALSDFAEEDSDEASQLESLKNEHEESQAQSSSDASEDELSDPEAEYEPQSEELVESESSDSSYEEEERPRAARDLAWPLLPSKRARDVGLEDKVSDIVYEEMESAHGPLGSSFARKVIKRVLRNKRLARGGPRALQKVRASVRTQIGIKLSSNNGQ